MTYRVQASVQSPRLFQKSLAELIFFFTFRFIESKEKRESERERKKEMIKEEEEEKTDRECSAGGSETCGWAASRRGCRSWCRRHAGEWASRLVEAIGCASKSSKCVMLTIDRLGASGQRNTFARSVDIGALSRIFKEEVNEGNDDGEETKSKIGVLQRVLATDRPIVAVSASVMACGLKANPPDRIVCEWESQFNPADLLESTKWKGYSKQSVNVLYMEDETPGGRGSYILIDSVDGVQRNGKTASEAADAIAALMSNPTLRGTHIVTTFDITIGGWTTQEIERAVSDFDVTCPGLVGIGGCGGRFYYVDGNVQSPMLGGAHVAVDCGSFAAQWHNLGYMEVNFPPSPSLHLMSSSGRKSNNRVHVRLSMLW